MSTPAPAPKKRGVISTTMIVMLTVFVIVPLGTAVIAWLVAGSVLHPHTIGLVVAFVAVVAVIALIQRRTRNRS